MLDHPPQPAVSKLPPSPLLLSTLSELYGPQLWARVDPCDGVTLPPPCPGPALRANPAQPRCPSPNSAPELVGHSVLMLTVRTKHVPTFFKVQPVFLRCMLGLINSPRTAHVDCTCPDIVRVSSRWEHTENEFNHLLRPVDLYGTPARHSGVVAKARNHVRWPKDRMLCVPLRHYCIPVMMFHHVLGAMSQFPRVRQHSGSPIFPLPGLVSM